MVRWGLGPAGAEGGRLTWTTAEGGDDGQNAHDAQVRDPGGVVLRESSSGQVC